MAVKERWQTHASSAALRLPLPTPKGRSSSVPVAVRCKGREPIGEVPVSTDTGPGQSFCDVTAATGRDKKPFHFPGPKNGDAFNLEIGNLYSLNPEKRSNSESSEEPPSEQPDKYGILFNGPKLGENRIVLGFQGYSKPAKAKSEESVPEKQKSASSEERQASSVSLSEESSQSSSKSESSSEEAKAVNPVVSSSEENPEVLPSEENTVAAVNEEASSAIPEVPSGDNNNASAVNEEASPAKPEDSSNVQDDAPVSEGKNSPRQKINVPDINQKIAPVPARFLPFLRANSLRDRRNVDNVRPNPVKRVRGLNHRPLRSVDYNIPSSGNDLRNEGRNKVLGPQGGIEANKQKSTSQRQRLLKY